MKAAEEQRQREEEEEKRKAAEKRREEKRLEREVRCTLRSINVHRRAESLESECTTCAASPATQKIKMIVTFRPCRGRRKNRGN